MVSELKPWSATWHSVWEQLLKTSVVIRSFVRPGKGHTYFSTELFFIPNPMEISAPGVCRVSCKRGMGNTLGLRATELRLLGKSFEEVLADLNDEFDRNEKSAIGAWLLEPRAHAALLVQYRAKDQLSLQPFHPLLLLHYGMVYELIATRKRNRTEDDGKIFSSHTTQALWATLEQRFGKFLFQQQEIVARHTLGEPIL